MSGRTFEAWRAQLTAYLIQSPAEVSDRLLLKLEHLHPQQLAEFLIQLKFWADEAGVALPGELLPTTEEIHNWLR